jgi:hypothetical protein
MPRRSSVAVYASPLRNPGALHSAARQSTTAQSMAACSFLFNLVPFGGAPGHILVWTALHASYLPVPSSRGRGQLSQTKLGYPFYVPNGPSHLLVRHKPYSQDAPSTGRIYEQCPTTSISPRGVLETSRIPVAKEQRDRKTAVQVLTA